MTFRTFLLAAAVVSSTAGIALAQKVPVPDYSAPRPSAPAQPAPVQPAPAQPSGGGSTPSTVPVRSDLVTADINTVLRVAQRAGSARIETNNEGRQYIVGSYDSLNYVIDFYNCDDRGCNDLAFSAGFDLNNVDINRINEWNRTKRFGSAYLDNEGDPVLLMPVNLAFGVSQQNLEDSFEWWKAVLTDYVGFIGFR